MYKEKTFENILKEMLAAAPEGIDTRCGSIFYDAVAPVAAELAKIYAAYDRIMEEVFPDTASLPYLIRHGKKHGIVRAPASCAVLSGHFDKPIGEGTKFLLGGHSYISGEFLRFQNGYYYYEMHCEDAGADANSSASGNFIPLSYIEGLTVSSADFIISPGTDEEDIEAFRKRVCATGIAEAYGGNISDYTSYIMGIDGVGGVKIYPAWAGGGTVRALIQADDGGIPSQDLLSSIKALLDPDMYSGTGAGVAPIGHMVTIDGVNGYDIRVTADLTYADGWNSTSAAPYIKEAVSGYISELRSGWQNANGTVVRIAQIESAIIKTGCVVDISGTMIYSVDDGAYVAQNIMMSEEFVPVYKEFAAV